MAEVKYMKAKDIVDGKHDTYLKQWLIENIFPYYNRRVVTYFMENIDHIINMIKHIVADKFGIMKGGSFTHAIANKDPFTAIMHADDVNRAAFPLYFIFYDIFINGGKIK